MRRITAILRLYRYGLDEPGGSLSPVRSGWSLAHQSRCLNLRFAPLSPSVGVLIYAEAAQRCGGWDVDEFEYGQMVASSRMWSGLHGASSDDITRNLTEWQKT